MICLPSVAVFVARIAIHAVVDIPGNAAVPLVRGRLGVAVSASKDGVVRRVGMARGTNPVGAAMSRVKPRVIESCSSPRGGRVAGGASGGESRGGVVGIGGAVVIGPMAGVTIRRRCGIDTIDVTLGAGYSNVRAGEREGRFGMIEDCASPGCGAVANAAVSWKTCGGMVWIGRFGVVGLVAAKAINRKGCVVVVDVACAAGCGNVSAGQRKRGFRMVERRRNPAARGMADRTVRRKAGCNVVGIRS